MSALVGVSQDWRLIGCQSIYTITTSRHAHLWNTHTHTHTRTQTNEAICVLSSVFAFFRSIFLSILPIWRVVFSIGYVPDTIVQSIFAQTFTFRISDCMTTSVCAIGDRGFHSKSVQCLSEYWLAACQRVMDAVTCQNRVYFYHTIRTTLRRDPILQNRNQLSVTLR